MADIARIIAFNRLRRLAILVIAVACFGCAGHNLEGKWLGNRNLTKPDGTKDFLTEMAGKVELEIKHGNKFDLYEGGYPKSGTLRYDQGKAFLRIEKLMGKPIAEHGDATVAMNEELVLTIIDRDTLTLEDPRGFDKRPIRLERVAQPSGNLERN